MSRRSALHAVRPRSFHLCALISALALFAPALQAQDPVLLTRNRTLGVPVSPYDARVSPYSPVGARNPYATDGGRIYGADGTYLGRLNANRYDPESVSNPYGAYGSTYSPTSINNPYGAYGSAYSNTSARNPYASAPPVVRYESRASDTRTRPSVAAWERLEPVTPWRQERP
jgi:hypothetical protein